MNPGQAKTRILIARGREGAKIPLRRASVVRDASARPTSTVLRSTLVAALEGSTNPFSQRWVPAAPRQAVFLWIRLARGRLASDPSRNSGLAAAVSAASDALVVDEVSLALRLSWVEPPG